MLAKDVERGVAADQDSVDLKLQAGENHLLLKIMNYGGDTGFYFALATEAVAIPAEVRRPSLNWPKTNGAETAGAVREYFRNQVADSAADKRAANGIDEVAGSKGGNRIREIPVSLVFREAKQPKPAYVLNRGEYDQPGDEVPRAHARRPPADA